MITTSIYGHHLEITDALKQHINSKTTLLNNHFQQLNLKFILETRGKDNMAEVNTRLLGKDFNMKVIGEDMYVVISKLIKKLDRWLRKNKQKHLA